MTPWLLGALVGLLSAVIIIAALMVFLLLNAVCGGATHNKKARPGSPKRALSAEPDDR